MSPKNVIFQKLLHYTYLRPIGPKLGRKYNIAPKAQELPKGHSINDIFSKSGGIGLQKIITFCMIFKASSLAIG